MAYVTQEDVILYVENITTFSAGVDCQFRLIVYKDHLNSQMVLKNVDAITITIFDGVGRRVLSYEYPEIPGKSSSLSIGDALNNEQGFN